MIFQNANTPTKVIESASQVTNVAYSSVDNLVKFVIEQLPYIVAGIVVLFFFWIVGKFLRSAFLTASNRTKLDYRLRILVSRLIGVAVFVLGIFTALTIIIPSFQFGDLIAGLGFTSFIVGFATKDILNNLLSGVLILWKEPFKIGDYIFVKDRQGKVEYIGVRATTLRMDDGEKILMPNGDMYSNPLTIRGAGAERRMKLEISIGYEAEIEQAKTNVLKVLREAEGVVGEPPPNVYVTDLAAEGVNLSIYFWIKADENDPMAVFDRVAMGIKKVLGKSEIRLYPTSPIVVQETKVELSSDEQNDEREVF
ncbi:MAG: mechanosensitive ion channel family protein [Acidobacteriota bacterium]|nr:mechanosensitive ion channel family protein [Acidobacteriota bacterium]